MPDAAKVITSDHTSNQPIQTLDNLQSLASENERLRDTVAEIVLQLDVLWKQLNDPELHNQHRLRYCVTRFRADH